MDTANDMCDALASEKARDKGDEMPAVKIDAMWMAWRVNATRRQSTMLRKLSTLSAAAAHDYRMGETPVGYTVERNAQVLRCLAAGVPDRIVAIAANLSPAKIADIKREGLRTPVAV